MIHPPRPIYCPEGAKQWNTSAYRPNPYVQTPAEFYLKIPDGYNEWPIKWWREVIQNAVDAKATDIYLNCCENDDGTWTASCEDNGRGMDERTLIDKFFAMGATTKGGEETIGGFGIAKGLIAFAWRKWEIHTRDLLVEGRINYYDMPRKTAMRVGTRVTAVMEPTWDRHTTPEAAMELLQRSSVSKTKFYINGRQFAQRLREGRPIKNKWGSEASLNLGPVSIPINYNQSVKSGEVYVRSNGLYMFTQHNLWNSELGTVTIEIPGKYSRQVLADNRDSFRDRYVGQELNALAKEIAVEGEAALKHKSRLVDKAWNIGGLMDVADEQSATASVVGGMTPREPLKPGISMTISIEEAEEVIKRTAFVVEQEMERARLLAERRDVVEKRFPVTAEVMTAIFSAPIPGRPTQETTAQQLIWTPAYRLMNNKEGYTVSKHFYPETMSPPVELLLKTWAEACRWVFIQLGYPGRYGVGFVFEDEVGACYAPDAERVKWLLLRPLAEGFEDKKLLSKSNREHLKWIYSSAIHEATHMANNISSHDRAFSYATSRNVAICADGFNTMIRIANVIQTDADIAAGENKRKRVAIKPEEEIELKQDVSEEAAVEERDPDQETRDHAYKVGFAWGKARPDDPRSPDELWSAPYGGKSYVKKAKFKPDFVRGVTEGRGK